MDKFILILTVRYYRVKLMLSDKNSLGNGVVNDPFSNDTFYFPELLTVDGTLQLMSVLELYKRLFALIHERKEFLKQIEHRICNQNTLLYSIVKEFQSYYEFYDKLSRECDEDMTLTQFELLKTVSIKEHITICKLHEYLL